MHSPSTPFFNQKLSNKLTDGEGIESSLIWVEFKFDYLETWKQFTYISIKCLILIKMLWMYESVESLLYWDLKDTPSPIPHRLTAIIKLQQSHILLLPQDPLSAQRDDNNSFSFLWDTERTKWNYLKNFFFTGCGAQNNGLAKIPISLIPRTYENVTLYSKRVYADVITSAS